MTGAAAPGVVLPGAPLALEIAVTGPAGARVARDGGADRVELCSALELGGVTPSAALVEAASAVGLPVQALVRCRPGSFVYDADEIALMVAEVRSVIASGARGVVIGALTPTGALDLDAMRRLVDAARSATVTVGHPVETTLHRAVDHAADPVATAAQLASLGLTRVLTSGGAAAAVDGAAAIAAMVAAAPGVQVMAGGGVRPGDIARLAATGAAAVHLSAKLPVHTGRTGAGVSLGSADSSDGSDTHFVTDPHTVAAARAEADAARR